MCGRFRRGSSAVLKVEMPNDHLSAILQFDRQAAVGRPLNQIVVAESPVAVGPKTNDVDRKGVAGHRGLNIERSRLRIPAEYTPDAVVVVPACVDCSGVDGVSGVDGEDRRIEGGKLTVENRRVEVVALRWSGRTRRTKAGSERVGRRMDGRVGVVLCYLAV